MHKMTSFLSKIKPCRGTIIKINGCDVCSPAELSDYIRNLAVKKKMHFQTFEPFRFQGSFKYSFRV